MQNHLILHLLFYLSITIVNLYVPKRAEKELASQAVTRFVVKQLKQQGLRDRIPRIVSICL